MSGLVLGILVVIAHENASEIFSLFNIHIPSNPASGDTPLIYFKYTFVVQYFYNIGLFPWFFLSYLLTELQYFLVPVTYGIVGGLASFLYGQTR